MKKRIVLIAFGLWTSLAIAQESPVGKEAPAPDQATNESAATKAASETPPAATEAKEFSPPPGFVTKKRGKLVLYCKRDTPIGTRFKTERCYNEDQVRDYIIAQQENKRDMDRVRSTCSSGGEPCRHP